MNLLVLDLDSTITKSDNLVGFSLFMLLKKRTVRFSIIVPLILLLKLKIINNINFKIWFSKLVFRSMDVSFLSNCANEYVRSNSFQRDLNPNVIDFITKFSDAEKIIISANYDFLVKPISISLSIEKSVCINLTQTSGRYTGSISGIIPYGKGKVESFSNSFNKNNYEKTIGIGDSKSDMPILTFLDEGYLIKYNKQTNQTIFTKV